MCLLPAETFKQLLHCTLKWRGREGVTFVVSSAVTREKRQLQRNVRKILRRSLRLSSVTCEFSLVTCEKVRGVSTLVTGGRPAIARYKVSMRITLEHGPEFAVLKGLEAQRQKENIVARRAYKGALSLFEDKTYGLCTDQVPFVRRLLEQLQAPSAIATPEVPATSPSLSDNSATDPRPATEKTAPPKSRKWWPWKS
jgi:hypothetical protein